jgi:hypothetical protein
MRRSRYPAVPKRVNFLCIFTHLHFFISSLTYYAVIFHSLLKKTLCSLCIKFSRVPDPHHFYAAPDPTFPFYAAPDPDPANHQMMESATTGL